MWTNINVVNTWCKLCHMYTLTLTLLACWCTHHGGVANEHAWTLCTNSIRNQCVFWVVAAPDPKMKTCRNMHWLRIEFVHKVHVCSFATPPWCMCQHTNRVKVNVYMWHSLHHVFTTLMFTSPLQLISYKSGFKNEFWCIRTSILIR